jgi:hypothetical protein
MEKDRSLMRISKKEEYRKISKAINHNLEELKNMLKASD